MLTAHATLEISIQAMRRGGSDFLLKPCDIDELLGSIKQAMARRRQKLQQKMAARLLADSLGLREGSQPGGEAGRTIPRYPAPAASPARLEARGLILDMEAMTVVKQGQPLSLTRLNFACWSC